MKSFQSRFKYQKQIGLTVLIVLVGLATLLFTHAASPTANFEPEMGQVNAPANKLTGNGSSGTGYVKFVKPSTVTGNIYVLGDSWMERYRDWGTLAARISANNWNTVTVNASGGRSVANGLQTIANDSSIVANVDKVVVNLGQNSCEWHGPATEFVIGTYADVNSLVEPSHVVGYDCPVDYPRQELDTILVRYVSLVYSINPRAKILWFTTPDTTKTAITNALHASNNIIVSDALQQPDLWDAPSLRLDNTYHPNEAYSIEVAQKIANVIGAP